MTNENNPSALMKMAIEGLHFTKEESKAFNELRKLLENYTMRDLEKILIA